MFPLYDDNPTVRFPYATIGLIAINLLVTLWTSQLSPVDRQLEDIKHGFVPLRIQQLSDPKLVVKITIETMPADDQAPGMPQQRVAVQTVQLDPVPTQILLSVLTAMFLHGGWLHVLGNMWFLWIFGNNIEDRLGTIVFVIFYFIGGILATTCHWIYDPHSTMPVIGASGAVATILGAYAVTFPKARVHTLVFLGIITTFEIPALIWLGLWFVGELFTAFATRDLTVAVWAHIGGFGAGVLLMPLLSLGCPPPGGAWHEEVKRHFTPADRVALTSARRYRKECFDGPTWLRPIDPTLDLSRHLIRLEEIAQPFEPAALFGREARLEIEVGSGKGLFLSAAATGDADNNFLGIEILAKYARFVAARLATRELDNARAIHGDAQHFFRAWLADNSIAAVHVYFPDPWWKARHKKRRVMNESFLRDVERTLRPGGTLHFWTDVEEYYHTALETIAAHTGLIGPQAVVEKPADHDLDYRTHFERRMRLHDLPVYRSQFSKR